MFPLGSREGFWISCKDFPLPALPSAHLCGAYPGCIHCLAGLIGDVVTARLSFIRLSNQFISTSEICPQLLQVSDLYGVICSNELADLRVFCRVASPLWGEGMQTLAYPFFLSECLSLTRPWGIWV